MVKYDYKTLKMGTPKSDGTCATKAPVDVSFKAPVISYGIKVTTAAYADADKAKAKLADFAGDMKTLTVAMSFNDKDNREVVAFDTEAKAVVAKVDPAPVAVLDGASEGVVTTMAVALGAAAALF